MSEMSLEETESTTPADNDEPEPGMFKIEEVTATEPVRALAPSADVTAAPPAAQQRSNRSATIEHLAARRAVTELSADAPEVKQTISELRTELTILVTDLRWGGLSAKETADRSILLLNVGSLQKWIPLLVPHILETDRASDLVPAWLKIIEQQDP